MGDSFNAVMASPHGKAAFSRCGRYRWWLRRCWRHPAPTLLFLGLNPSSADARRDDPTLRRLIGFAERWGYGALEVLNLFSWISPDPTALRRCHAPVGSQTDAWLRRRVRALADEEPLALWLGWGNGGSWQGRDQRVLQLLERLPVRLHSLGTTACRQPRHPLYARAGSPLLPFTPCLGHRFEPPNAPCHASRAATRST